MTDPDIVAARAAALQLMRRDYPPPPDETLPEGCSQWRPRYDVDRDEDGRPRVLVTWEAKP